MLTVTTWNVQNLFPAGSADGPNTQNQYDDKLDALADTVQALAPDVLALQEIGDRLSPGSPRTRRRHLAHGVSTHPDARGIRVGFASRLPVTVSQEVIVFAAGLAPIQSNDTGGTATAPSRGFLEFAVTVPGAGSLQLVTAHLKSKLLAYPNGRFQPRDEDERARFAAYALSKRAAEATTLRAHLTQLLARRRPDHPDDPVGRPQRRPEGRHHPDPPRATGIGDRHAGRNHPRPR